MVCVQFLNLKLFIAVSYVGYFRFYSQYNQI